MSNILANNINPRSGNKITIGNVNTTVAIAGTATYEDVTSIDSVGIITARAGIRVTNGSVGIGTINPDQKLHVFAGGHHGIIKVETTLSGKDARLDLQGSSTGNSKINFGDESSAFVGGIIYNHSNNSMALKTNGAERFNIISNGNIGIGTTNPLAKLHVLSAGDPFILIEDSSGTDETFVRFKATNVNRNWSFGVDHQHDAFVINNSFNLNEGVQKFYIDSNGKVGIGTTIPSRQLEVYNTNYAKVAIKCNIQSSLFFADDDDVNIGQISYVHTDNHMYFRVNDAERLRITSGGNVGIGTIAPQRDLHIHNSDSSTNTYLQLTSATTGTTSTDGFQLWAYGSGGNQNAVIAQRENADIEIWTNNTERLRIDSNGYMTKAPSGMVIRSGFYDPGTGINARTVTTSATFTTANINGTGQVGHNIGKFSDDGLTYTKVSSNSHLNISISIPFYLATGGTGFGIRALLSTDDGSNYSVVSGLSDGPANKWGAGGYGGNTSGILNYTWNTRMNSAKASAILSKTGTIRFYFEVCVWTNTDTLTIGDYPSYNKKSSIIVQEIAE